jgi:hypothetical protein
MAAGRALVHRSWELETGPWKFTQQKRKTNPNGIAPLLDTSVAIIRSYDGGWVGSQAGAARQTKPNWFGSLDRVGDDGGLAGEEQVLEVGAGGEPRQVVAVDDQGAALGMSSFRAYWDYDGGGLADMGQHHLDAIHWTLGKDRTSPVEVEAHAPWPAGPEAVGPWGHIIFTYADGTKIVIDSREWGEPWQGSARWPSAADAMTHPPMRAPWVL